MMIVCHHVISSRLSWVHVLLMLLVRLPQVFVLVRDGGRRGMAQALLQEHILPSLEYSRRTSLGRKAQGIDSYDVVAGQDERLYQTYGEFPLESFDILLDRATTEWAIKDAERHSKRPTFVDLGSGCGRLVLYMALTRPDWDVHGIELSPLLHSEAIQAHDRARASGWCTQDNNISFHCGDASQFRELLQGADIIFCYSTTWKTNGFSPERGTLVLAQEWNNILSACRDGVVITTDRSLDSSWQILDKIDVPNPEAYESTGYIQVRS